MKKYLLLVALLLVGIVGCQSTPQFVNQPRPNLASNYSPFKGVDALTDLRCDRAEKPTEQLVRFVVWTGKYQVISNTQGLRDLYAPIESADEALSYALAASALDAYYGLRYETDKYTYLSSVVEDTHVEVWPAGYSVHRYQYVPIGCDNHPTDEVGLFVSRDGAVSTVGSTEVYQDTHYICGD